MSQPLRLRRSVVFVAAVLAMLAGAAAGSATHGAASQSALQQRPPSDPAVVIVDAGILATGTADLVGRPVDVKNVTVLQAAPDGGFFINAPGGAVLVMPTHTAATVAPGDIVSIQGTVAEVTREIAQRVNPPTGWNPRIYVVATAVTK